MFKLAHDAVSHQAAVTTNGGYVIKVTMRSFQTFELTTETSTSVPQPGAEQNSTFETEQPEN